MDPFFKDTIRDRCPNLSDPLGGWDLHFPPQVPPSDDAFTDHHLASLDWKTSFPLSCRVLNVAYLAYMELQAHGQRYLGSHDPTYLHGSISSERMFFDRSTSAYDYLSEVMSHVLYIQSSFQNSEGKRSPQLDSKSGKDVPIPFSYVFTQPISHRYMVVQLLKPKPRVQMLKPGQLDISFFVQDREKVRKGLADICTPFQSLLNRHNSIKHLIEKLLPLFRSKLDVPHDIERWSGCKTMLTSTAPCVIKLSNALVSIPVLMSCEALLDSLNSMTIVLNTLEKQAIDLDLQIEFLENVYASTVMQAIKTFIYDISVNLTKLQCQQQSMRFYSLDKAFRDADTSSTTVDLTSQQSHDSCPENHQKAKPILEEQQRWKELVDPRLGERCSDESLNQAVSIAKMCLQEDPDSRPLMSVVVKFLNQIVHLAEGPDISRKEKPLTISEPRSDEQPSDHVKGKAVVALSDVKGKGKAVDG